MAEPLLQLGGKRRDNNIVAMLSLYLLLLAFFILLNTLSKFEEDRTRVVLESVNTAFNGRVQSIKSVKPYSAALGPLEDAVALLGELGRLFNQILPAARTEVAADGPVLRLEMNADALFRPGRTDLQFGRGLLLNRLSKALLNERNSALHIEIEVLHGIPEEGNKTVAGAGARSLEVQRMGVLVRELTARKLPAERPGVVQLVIRVFEQAPENLDFGDLAE